MIDPDDLRREMPGVDLTQALWAIREYSHLGAVVPVPQLEARAIAAFKEGYGQPFPTGAALWLPQLRNLAVVVLTLARRSRRWSLSRISDDVRYRRAVLELDLTIEHLRQSARQAA
jgi:hypothetical protein